VVDGSHCDDESIGDADRGGGVKVLFYGRLAEAIGRELEIDIAPGSSVAELRERLASLHPETGQVLLNKRSRTFVDSWIVLDDYRLGIRDTLEFLSPVSGG
jgi:molybdopterin converting factor small subunit